MNSQDLIMEKVFDCSSLSREDAKLKLVLTGICRGNNNFTWKEKKNGHNVKKYRFDSQLLSSASLWGRRGI